MLNGCIYTAETQHVSHSAERQEHSFSVLTFLYADRKAGNWITIHVIGVSGSTHPLVFGFPWQAPLHSFNPQLLLGRVHVEEGFGAQVQFLKSTVIKQINNVSEERAADDVENLEKYYVINSHWPQSINIGRFCITAEPWFKAAVWRLTVHIPRSCEKPKWTKTRLSSNT